MTDDDPLAAIEPGFGYEATREVGQIEPQEVADGIEIAATPEIIGAMEKAVYDGVVPRLPEGHRIVGVRVECDHRAPTPAGEEITTSIEVEEVDAERGQLVSTATVEDEAGLAATGRMRHAVVEREAFAERVRERAGGD
ncbi:thioesterase family protein [Halorussus sp. AFM4]|uniref:thioesterase family protein n=1 Tax=Halorussus sp. AFM4 TaxID=3421651 RepID=UPI003EC1444E